MSCRNCYMPELGILVARYIWDRDCIKHTGFGLSSPDQSLVQVNRYLIQVTLRLGLHRDTKCPVVKLRHYLLATFFPVGEIIVSEESQKCHTFLQIKGDATIFLCTIVITSSYGAQVKCIKLFKFRHLLHLDEKSLQA